MQLSEFNAADRLVASTATEPCLAVPRWVEEVVDGRPYRDRAALRDQAAASAQILSDAELAAALAHHPRIGERLAGSASEAGLSRAEQAGVDASDPKTAQRLRRANERYEARFDRVFLIRAAGRSAEETLAELDRRLGNDDETERREVVSQLREIALLRLDDVVTG